MPKRLVLGFLVFLTIVAVACGGSEPTSPAVDGDAASSEPTPDLPATVAAEVQATLTAMAGQAPTATPTASTSSAATSEPEPTATPLPPVVVPNPTPTLIPPSQVVVPASTLLATVAAVQLTPVSASLVEGETRLLQNIAVDGFGNPLAGRPVSWSSSNAAVARVSATGQVTGASAGLASVTATVEGVGATAVIEVQHGAVASVEIALGTGAELVAILRDVEGHLLQDRSVSWSSSDAGVLQVDPASGDLAAISLGSANVTATSEGISAAVSIQVSNEPVALITVAPAAASLQAGESIQLSAAPLDVGGQLLSGRTVTWSSSNPQVAQVSASGTVTGVSAGSASITASSENIQATANITVTQVAVALVAISSAASAIEEGEIVQLSAVAQDSGGQDLAGRLVTWSSGDDAVIQVSATGLVTGLTAGVATVSATSDGVSGTTTVEVNHGAVASVEISLGGGTQLLAALRDGPGHVLLDRSVTWVSSDPGVVGVEPLTGQLTVGTVGVATVSGTSEGVTASASITVNPEPVASVTATPDPAAVEVGASIQMAAAPRDGAGNLLTGRQANWASASEGVATVSDTGLVTGVADGIVTITATVDGVIGTATLTVFPQSVVDYSLLLSASFDRLSAIPLEGASLSGNIYVFSEPIEDVEKVSFYVDDPQRQENPLRTEKAAPYDLGGTRNDSTANRYDTSQLSNGAHTITAEITLNDGTTVLVTATFNVETTVAAPPPLAAETYSLLWSASSNRSNPAPLEGAALPETAYVFTDPDQGVAGVSFYLDDPNLQRSPFRTESRARYDLAGTQGNGNANGFDTRQLSNGKHTLTSAITLTDGSTAIVTATFSVDTPVAPPPSPLPPSSYSLNWASSSDRGYFMNLDDDSVSGVIYVFLGPEDGVDNVDFYIDNPSRTGSADRTESNAPFDLAGTRSNGRARPFDTGQLTSGIHTVTADVTFNDGSTVSVTASFTVVSSPVASVEIDPQSIAVAVGDFTTLTSIVKDSGGNVLTDREVTWSSDNPAVTISLAGPKFYGRYFENGNSTDGSDNVSVTSTVPGAEAVITATVDGVSATAFIRVFFPFASVSAGAAHTCGITPWGDAYCWGFGSGGRLGNGSTENQNKPVPVSGGLSFRSVTAGAAHTCGITADRDAYCWGAGSSHRLGNGSTDNRHSPEAVSTNLKFKSISAGGDRTCGISIEGAAYCWGSGRFGGLGNGSVEDQSEPVPVSGNHEFISISTSATGNGNYTCATQFEGDAYCWGRGLNGHLGNGAESDQDEPVMVLGGYAFSSVRTGNHACGVSSLGKMFCWGSGRYGELGNGSDGFGYSENSPVPVASEDVFQSMDAGYSHTCGVVQLSIFIPIEEQETNIYCWGHSGDGKLGIGFSGNQSTPRKISGEYLFSIVSAGESHTCAVTIEDEAYCWGDNFAGKLGSGPDTTDQVAPVPVLPP